MNDKIKARADLQLAWGRISDDSDGLTFGQTCYDWQAKLGKTEIYALYAELGIAPNVAHWWMERYLNKAGLKQAHKEKRQHRGAPPAFSDIQSQALRLLLAGYNAELLIHPDKRRQLLAAKDWAHSRLSRTDL